MIVSVDCERKQILIVNRNESKGIDLAISFQVVVLCHGCLDYVTHQSNVRVLCAV